MPYPWSDVIFWTACVTQFAAFLVVMACWSGRPGANRKWLHAAFYTTMMALGALAMLAFQLGSGCWASCGTTLAMMAVGATLDIPAPVRARVTD